MPVQAAPKRSYELSAYPTLGPEPDDPAGAASGRERRPDHDGRGGSWDRLEGGPDLARWSRPRTPTQATGRRRPPVPDLPGRAMSDNPMSDHQLSVEREHLRV